MEVKISAATSFEYRYEAVGSLSLGYVRFRGDWERRETTQQFTIESGGVTVIIDLARGAEVNGIEIIVREGALGNPPDGMEHFDGTISPLPRNLVVDIRQDAKVSAEITRELFDLCLESNLLGPTGQFEQIVENGRMRVSHSHFRLNARDPEEHRLAVGEAQLAVDAEAR